MARLTPNRTVWVPKAHHEPGVQKETSMNAPQPRTDPRRFRLAGNHNEAVVSDRKDPRRYRLGGNHNETVVSDRKDLRRYRLATNHNETVVATR